MAEGATPASLSEAIHWNMLSFLGLSMLFIAGDIFAFIRGIKSQKTRMASNG